MLGIGWMGPGYQFEDLDDDEPQTWPPAGTAKLKIEQEIDPVFFSATWTIRARVDGKVIGESVESQAPVDDSRVHVWARLFIKNNHEKLRRMGVDAVSDYVLWGGAAKDLD